MESSSRKEIEGFLKTGLMAGLIGGVVVVSSFMEIDDVLGLKSGEFFEMFGYAIGSDAGSAISLLFVLTMITAAVIGIIYSILSSFWRTVQIVSFQKGIITGALTGIIVFALFFLPIHYFAVVPTVETILETDASLPEDIEHSMGVLLEHTDTAIWRGLLLHVMFGSVMGLFCGFIFHEKYSSVKKFKKIF